MLPQNQTLAALAACEPDLIHLDTIGGAAYYELHTIVRERDGVRETIGRASDWPLLRRDAEIARLTAEVDALKAALRAQPAAPALAEPTPPVAFGQPAGTGESAPAHTCPECGAAFKKAHGLNVHRASKHRPASDAPPAARPASIVVEPEAAEQSPPFRCARCQSDAHAPSRKRPDLCIRCNARVDAETTPTGYPVAA